MVYVITDNHKNLTPATHYGQLRIMLTGKEPLPQAIKSLREKLSQFTSEDHLVLLGHPLLIAVAFAFIMRKNGHVNVLTWNRENYTYRADHIPCSLIH